MAGGFLVPGALPGIVTVRQSILCGQGFHHHPAVIDTHINVLETASVCGGLQNHPHLSVTAGGFQCCRRRFGHIKPGVEPVRNGGGALLNRVVNHRLDVSAGGFLKAHVVGHRKRHHHQQQEYTKGCQQFLSECQFHLELS